LGHRLLCHSLVRLEFYAATIDAIYSTDEVIATQRRCYEILKLVSK